MRWFLKSRVLIFSNQLDQVLREARIRNLKDYKINMQVPTLVQPLVYDFMPLTVKMPK